MDFYKRTTDRDQIFCTGLLGSSLIAITRLARCLHSEQTIGRRVAFTASDESMGSKLWLSIMDDRRILLDWNYKIINILGHTASDAAAIISQQTQQLTFYEKITDKNFTWDTKSCSDWGSGDTRRAIKLLSLSYVFAMQSGPGGG